MDRRELFTAAGAAGLAAVATSAFAADDQEHMHHAHMDHEGMEGMVMTKPHQALVDTALGCTKAGLACISHCLDSFAAGDTKMSGCARSVDQMQSVVETLAKLASVSSPHLHAMAKVAVVVCEDCEKECRKHADDHPVCKACADACAANAKECKKITA